MDKHNVTSIVAKHFENQIQDGVEHGVDMCECSPESLGSAITAKEVETAFARFNRAFGYDSIPCELLKYIPAELSTLIAVLFHEFFDKHFPLEEGAELLIAQQKPGKPRPSEEPKVNRAAGYSTKDVISLHYC